MNLFRRLFRRAQTAPAAPARKKGRINWDALLMLAGPPKQAPEKRPVARYEPAPGVVPATEKAAVAAMDATPYDFCNAASYYGMALENGFPGYPYLAQLAQLPEYRKITCTIAEEMTRKWIKLRVVGEGDKADKLEKLEAALTRHHVRDAFRAMAEHDGFFGRGQIYIDVRKPGGVAASEDQTELQTPLLLSANKIKKGSLNGFRVVEPMWTYPGLYNSTNPLAKDYYKPSTWYVMGNIVHDSRFVMMISRPVPDMLKAAYSFGGISMSQLARPYIDNWLRTRDSVSDVVHSFSINGLGTDLETLLAPDLTGAGDLLKRVQLFNQLRDNRGLMVTNKETEEFFQLYTSLSGLHELQAQAQEQMASVASIPLVKLLGITPAGLNANSDGEIRVFYDSIHAAQQNMFRDPLKRVLDVIQLDEFGEIDPDITFEFEPLFQLSSLEMASQRKVEADTDAELIEAGVIDATEARARLIADPNTPYTSLENADEVPTDDFEAGEEGEESADRDTAKQGSSGG